MKQFLVLGVALVTIPATAQPVQPMPTTSTPVAVALSAAPHRDISNMLITARLGTTDGTRGFYRGTRFDQAGQVFSLMMNGRQFYGPWFDAVAPDVLGKVCALFLKAGQYIPCRRRELISASRHLAFRRSAKQVVQNSAQVPRSAR